MDDLPRREEVLSWNPERAALSHAVLATRDENLVERIAEQLAKTSEAKRIAIAYGAAHMRAVIRALTRAGKFYSREASWLTVFGPTNMSS
jgi:hypothetical protein